VLEKAYLVVEVGLEIDCLLVDGSYSVLRLLDVFENVLLAFLGRTLELLLVELCKLLLRIFELFLGISNFLNYHLKCPVHLTKFKLILLYSLLNGHLLWFKHIFNLVLIRLNNHLMALDFNKDFIKHLAFFLEDLVFFKADAFKLV